MMRDSPHGLVRSEGEEAWELLVLGWLIQQAHRGGALSAAAWHLGLLSAAH